MPPSTRQVEKHLRETRPLGRRDPIAGLPPRGRAPLSAAELPEGHDGLGLGAARRLRRSSSWSTPRSTRASSADVLRCACAAPCRRTSSRRTRRRTRASSRPSFALKVMGDIQAVLHRQRGAELLLGLDFRLPHGRGRSEPDQPAGVHAGQRVHLRRVLPRARHGGRRLRSEPLVLLLQRLDPSTR